MDGFAEFDVFLLYQITKGEVFGKVLSDSRTFRIAKIPFEHGHGLFGTERQNDIDLDIVGVDIQHQIRKNPIIECLSIGVICEVPTIQIVFFDANGRILLGVITFGDDLVVVVINEFEQARVCDGDMVPLEVVIDIDLPIAVDFIINALVEAHFGNVHPYGFGDDCPKYVL